MIAGLESLAQLVEKGQTLSLIHLALASVISHPAMTRRPTADIPYCGSIHSSHTKA